MKRLSTSRTVETEKEKNVLDVSEYNFEPFSKLKSPKSPTLWRDDPKAWKAGLFNYLEDLLKILLKPEEHSSIPVFLSKKKNWIACFTHESVEPDRRNNYEFMEFIGDTTMAYSFAMYLFERYGGKVTQKESTNWKQRYLSKQFQSLLGSKMKLGEWVRTEYYYHEVNEDLLETFFAVFDIILYNSNNEGQDVPRIGYGSKVCLKLFEIVFEDIVFGEYANLNNLAWIQEIFSQATGMKTGDALKAFFSSIEPYKLEGSYNWESKFYINRRGVIELEKLGIEFPNKNSKGEFLLAKYQGPVKGTVKNKTAELARKKMIELGISEDFKERLSFKRIEEYPHFDKFKKCVKKIYGSKIDYTDAWVKLKTDSRASKKVNTTYYMLTVTLKDSTKKKLIGEVIDKTKATQYGGSEGSPFREWVMKYLFDKFITDNC